MSTAFHKHYKDNALLKFTFRTVLYLLILASIILILIIPLDIVDKTSAGKSIAICHNPLLIWGDSQTVQGIDMKMMATSSHFTPRSAAVHGGGVYDFLVFADAVPDSSECLIGFSQCCLLRRKDSDCNRTGISLRALHTLIWNGYSLKEAKDIFSYNKLPNRAYFSDYKDLWPYCDTLSLPEPISGFEEMYAFRPDFLDQKMSIYQTGIEILKQKHCHIIVVEFPYHSLVYKISHKSPYISDIDAFRQSVCRQLAIERIDTLHINDSDSLLMHDLTHLNEVGASRTTQKLTEYLDSANPECNHFISINGGSCN